MTEWTDTRSRWYWLGVVWSAIRIIWGSDVELHMRSGWVWFAPGMDPLVVIVYDRMGAKLQEEVWEQHERRVVITQGQRGIGDFIIDHQEGY